MWLHICVEIWWLDSMKCMHMIFRYRCNTIQLLKITYPEPWNFYFVSISWSKSPVKSSPNLQYKFLDWKWASPTPPLALFQKSDLVAGPFPYVAMVLWKVMKISKSIVDYLFWLLFDLSQSQDRQNFTEHTHPPFSRTDPLALRGIEFSDCGAILLHAVSHPQQPADSLKFLQPGTKTSLNSQHRESGCTIFFQNRWSVWF